jgi:hypothetical protein
MVLLELDAAAAEHVVVAGKDVLAEVDAPAGLADAAALVTDTQT